MVQNHKHVFFIKGSLWLFYTSEQHTKTQSAAKTQKKTGQFDHTANLCFSVSGESNEVMILLGLSTEYNCVTLV